MSDRETEPREAMLARIQDEALRAAFRLVDEFFAANGASRGTADVFCLGSDARRTLLAACAAYFAIAKSAPNRASFSKVLVIVNRRGDASEFGDHVISVLRAYAPNETPERAKQEFERRVELHRLETMDVEVLAALVRRAPSESVCIVESGANYRHATAPLRASYEDEWVGNVVSTVSLLETVAVERGVYVQVLAGRFRPRADENLQALMSIQGALVTEEQKGEITPEERLEGWLVQAKTDLAGALAAVENSGFSEDDKTISIALCRHAAGDARACDGLRPRLDGILATTVPENAAVLARIAEGDIPFSALLLETATTVRPEFVGHPSLLRLAFSVLETRLGKLDTPLREEAPEISDLSRALAFVTRYLGEHPRDGRGRVRLTNLLSTEASGLNGVVLLVWSALRQARLIELEQEPETKASEPAALEEFTAFHKQQWERRGETGVKGFVLAPEPLTPALSAEAADALLQRGTQVLEHMAWRFVADEGDSRAVLTVLKTCMDLAITARGWAETQQVLRVAAAGIADSGGHQLARDLAEHSLASCRTEASASETWFAWITFADIYHRIHNPLEALSAWVCGHSRPSFKAQIRQVFPAETLAGRILRDIGFFGPAREFCAHAKAMLLEAGVWDQNRHQVEGLEASIRFKELAGTRGLESEWLALADDLSSLIRRGIERFENVGVPGVMLAQVLRIIETQGWPEPQVAAKALEEAIGVVGEPVASRLRAYRATSPSLRDIRDAMWGALQPRYARDLGEDLQKAALLASRVLAAAGRAGSPESALASIELLLDHSIGIPEYDSVAAPAVTLGTALEAPERLVEVLRTVANRGVEVHALGVGEDGRLVRVSSVVGGATEVASEPPEIFSVDALHAWNAVVRPVFHRGKSAEVSLNATEQLMRRIGIGRSARAAGQVLIRGPGVADLPANLMLASGELIGAVAPVTSVPSLSWLSAELRRSAEAPPVRKAWLLPDSDRGALGILYDRLDEALPRHGFEVVKGGEPPVLSRAGVAVVAGHGSLWAGQGFFRVVSGEDDTRVAPFDVADTLKQTAVVVLLVCSGGRLERDLFSLRGIGLPHLLLAKGCRSVVASPWPIDAAMAGRWLESFLQGLEVGFSVAEATFHANGELHRASDRMPDVLAMHVYGNPFVRVPGAPRPVGS